jgi:ribosomal protein S18 acetylase RimI-like enzyme
LGKPDGAAVFDQSVSIVLSQPGVDGLNEAVRVLREWQYDGAALRELGSSSAIVCAESSNVGAVATYKSAGFQQLSEVPDLHRSA